MNSIDKHLSLSLQFSSIAKEQSAQLSAHSSLPSNIQGFVDDFEKQLSDEEFNSPKFAYRVLFVAKTANRKGQADEVIEFIKADSELAKNVNAKYAVVKETERPKLLPSKIAAKMRKEGFPKFRQHHHTDLWKQKDAKNPAKGLGVQVENTWYWYQTWLEQVRDYCKQNKQRFA
jgi:ClpP class serine protease